MATVKMIKLLEEAMTEQQDIINATENQCNQSKLDGMKQTLMYLGYDWVMREGKYKIFK